MQRFPNALLGSWHHIARFVNGSVAPMMNSMPDKFLPSPAKQMKHSLGEGQDGVENDTQADLIAQVHYAVARGLLAKYIFLEDIEGASDEVLLCLQKGKNLWGEGWKDYDELARKVAEQEKIFRAAHPVAGRNLTIQCFFASADQLVGTKGQQWLEGCWTAEIRGPLIDFESETVPDTDHNSLLPLERGAMGRVLKYVSHSPVQGPPVISAG